MTFLVNFMKKIIRAYIAIYLSIASASRDTWYPSQSAILWFLSFFLSASHHNLHCLVSFFFFALQKSHTHRYLANGFSPTRTMAIGEWETEGVDQGEQAWPFCTQHVLHVFAQEVQPNSCLQASMCHTQKHPFKFARGYSWYQAFHSHPCHSSCHHCRVLWLWKSESLSLHFLVFLKFN